MTTGFRAIQIAINGLLFMFMSYQLVDLIAGLEWWRMDRWLWRELLALLVCFVLLGSLVGSVRLNLQILRRTMPRSRCNVRTPTIR